jgi:hypothetical protein
VESRTVSQWKCNTGSAKLCREQGIVLIDQGDGVTFVDASHPFATNWRKLAAAMAAIGGSNTSWHSITWRGSMLRVRTSASAGGGVTTRLPQRFLFNRMEPGTKSLPSFMRRLAPLSEQ